ncbi:MAG: hypothetical protein LBU85_12625 [Treponema sp.]|jgi:hypothetical protein|nr:hypothetical protein [Treponema sp.]
MPKKHKITQIPPLGETTLLMTAKSGHKKRSFFIMYKKHVSEAISVLLLVFGAVLIGCDNGGGGLGLPGTAKASAIPNYSGRAVTNTDEAEDLLYAAFRRSDFVDTLQNAWQTASNQALTDKYGSDRYASQAGKKSFSFSVKIDDATVLKKEANDVTTGTVTGATMKGEQKYSWSSNHPYIYNKSYDWIPPVGTTQSSSSSQSIEYKISEGFYTETIGSGKVQIAGVVTVKNESSGSSKYKTAASDTAAPKYEEDYSSKYSTAIALSISDGTMGGKFIFSEASDYNGSRTAKTKGGNITSSVEVYDNAGKKVITLDEGSNYAHYFSSGDDDDYEY